MTPVRTQSAKASRRSVSLAALLLTGTALSCIPNAAHAQSTWNGVASENWFDPTNWTPNGVPDSSVEAIIDTSTPNDTIVDNAAATAGALTVGNIATGKLTIRNAGQLTINSDALIGQSLGSTGSVTVADAGSKFIVDNFLEVGVAGSGSMTISDGALVADKVGFIGIYGTGVGMVTVDGPTSSWQNSLGLNIGEFGQGTLNVTNGGTVAAFGATIGGAVGSTGTVNVHDTASFFNVTSSSAPLYVGYEGTGTLNITAGGSAQAYDVYIGYDAADPTHAGLGTVLIDGTASVFAILNGLYVGGNDSPSSTPGASGSLWISNGGLLISNGDFIVGSSAGATGQVSVTGAGSTLLQNGDLRIGDNDGTGTVSFAGQAQGSVSGNILLGITANATGTLTVDGAQTNLTTGILIVGLSGTGTLNVQNGGGLTSASGEIGDAAAGIGTVNLMGQGSSWTTGQIALGDAGNGSMTVSDSATLSYSGLRAGSQANSIGKLLVTGSGSTLTSTGFTTIGGAGTGVMNILNGGAVNGDVGQIGGDAHGVGVVTVDGAGSSWTNTDFLNVGNGGTGTLIVQNGAVVSAPTGLVAYTPNSTGTITVDGSGSTLTFGNSFALGRYGSGTLTVSNGGTLQSLPGVMLALNTGATGTLNIGADAASAAAAPGTVNASVIAFGDGTGIVNFNHTSQNYTFTPGLAGLGTINQMAGVTHLVSDSSGFSGATNVTGGTLFIDTNLGAGTVSVQSGASLGGSGKTTGEIDIADGGTLIGIQGQTLTTAVLSLTSGSNINVTLDTPGGSALFRVNNLLHLAGTLNISSPGAFGPGVYSLFSYGGTLINNGLSIGATPGGTAASDFTVQTGVAGQVNLVSTAQATLNFWDGDGANSANNNAVDGGSGVWSATNTNWTDANGTSNGAMTPQPGFAIFQTPGGTVTVDGSAGDIAVTGMQFASDGYNVVGDAITLTDPDSKIRVGDGSAAGANYVTTIGSVLTGAGGLEKTDLGTLILTGINSYTGGTTITGGTLQIGDGSAGGFASVAGAIVDNAQLVFNNQSAQQETSNDISGSGSVRISGVTTLTGTGSYTGGTVIDPTGTLYIGSGGTTGSITGDVANSGFLSFQHSDDIAFDGSISGTGRITQNGLGKLTLTGVNTFTGPTGILSGVLALAGSGSIAMSSSVNVTQAGTLDISATNAGASIATLLGAGNVVLGAQTLTLSNANDQFDGVIAGTGGFTVANGTETLTGANTYTGGTTIGTNGVVIIAGGGSIIGDVQDGRALAFNRTVDLTFGGAISGAGGVAQLGTNRTTLTGVNSYTGGTLIAQGTLIGSATSFGTGPINDQAAFIIDQSSDASFANVLGGAGSFTKQGAGTLTLTGNSFLTGATTVAAGRLSVNGSLANSVVTVKSGANLGGNGTVGGVIAESGSTIAPGNSIGLLHVAGDYNQASGSTYQVELTSTGQADRIDVAGTAVIANGAILNVTKTDAAPFVFGTQYVVLDAAGGISGTYTLSGNTQISNFIGLKLVYDANDIYLDVAQNKTFASAGSTNNQIATGAGLDSLPVTNPIVGAVVVMPDDATADAAFDQLSGEIHASVKTAMLEDGRVVRDAAIGRLLSNQGRGTGLWGTFTGSRATNDGNGNAATMTRNASNFVLGVDTSPAGGFTLGVLGGYGKSDVRLPARNSKAKINSYTAGVYAGAAAGPLKLRLGAAYSWQTLDTSRSVAFAGFSDKLNANYKASTAQAFGDVGYTIGNDRLNLEPFAQIAWMDVATDAFTETGGAAALKATKQSQNLGVVTLGLRGVAGFSIAGASARFHATAGWRQATGDRSPDASLSFASGGSAFDIAGAPIARTSAMIDTGLEVAVTPMLRLNVGYVGQIASRTRDNGVRAGLSMAF